MIDAKGNFWPRNPNSFSELLAERRGRKPEIRDPILKAILEFDEEKPSGTFDEPVKLEREFIF